MKWRVCALSLLGPLVGLLAIGSSLWPILDQATVSWSLSRRLGRLEHAEVTALQQDAVLAYAMAVETQRRGSLLSSWESIGGCGAGSSTGVGGIKWVGRSVRGGLFQLQTQGNYTQFKNGFAYTLNDQIGVDIGEKWNLGANIPYLYKYINDPFGLMYDVSNQGIGDVNLMATRKFGAINATAVTLSLGLPTGVHDAKYKSFILPQDRQLGAGNPSGLLILDHTLDNIWGPVVLGGVLSYPGGENDLKDYRSPSASLYAYAGYLLGPFVPALGASVTGFAAHDRDRAFPTDRPLATAAVSTSLEWSNDFVALLAGFSLPFSLDGRLPWTVALGLSIAPF